MPQVISNSILKLASGLPPCPFKTAFEREFIEMQPNIFGYVDILRRWRANLEILLDKRSKVLPLEQLSNYLIEFEYQKFDDVDIPGHSLKMRDSLTDAVRIERFLPQVHVLRDPNGASRRIQIVGHNGKHYSFLVQHPSPKSARMEERIIPMIALISKILDEQKEARKRKLSFTVPVIVPLAPHIRLLSTKSNYTSLHEIYDNYCSLNGQDKDAPIAFFLEKLKEFVVNNNVLF